MTAAPRAPATAGRKPVGKAAAPAVGTVLAGEAPLEFVAEPLGMLLLVGVGAPGTGVLGEPPGAVVV